MNISYSWLKDYLSTSLSPETLAEYLTSSGLEVESIEKVEAIPGGLTGVVVGEIVECGKHPDADRLRVTKVNVGTGEPLQIVCGAPNAAAGQKVLVATVGTTLHPISGEAFTIKKSKIRGVESLGMICAEDELGLGQGHDGILVLPESSRPGTPAEEVLGLESDFVFSIGLTPNRTDAFSHIGVARDLAAALNHMEGSQGRGAEVIIPSIANLEDGACPVKVSILDTDACRRYSGVHIAGVQIAPSPEWLKKRLNAIGIRPVNNVVDITNYVQHEIGQPLHAFDASKIENATIIVRRAIQDEMFTTLDGTARKLTSEDLVIADASQPMCLAGIFGGLDSGVSSGTKDIFLESAWFNAAVVRKSARRHGLNTDSSFRFERGTDPSVTRWSLQRAAHLILEIAGGTVSGGITDQYPNPASPVELDYHLNRAWRLIGKSLDHSKLREILAALDIVVLSENENEWRLRIPQYRVDVTREADVTEEVLRIYGYDNVEMPSVMRSSLSEAVFPDPELVRDRVSDMLASNGFNEIMGMSLTRTKYTEWSSDADYNAARSIALLNPLSSDLGVMRQTLLFTGLQAIELNQNHRNADLRLFEFGKEYRKTDEGRIVERYRLSLFLTGRRMPESWNNPSDSVGFSDLRGAVEKVLTATGIQGFMENSFEHDQFDDAVEWKTGEQTLVRAGSVNSQLLRHFDIRVPVWYADLDWDFVIRRIPRSPVSYKVPEKYPAVRRDLSLLVDQSVRFADISSSARSADKKVLRSIHLFDVYEGKNLEAGKKSYAVSFVLQDATKTMTDQQVDQIMGKIQKVLSDQLGAVLRTA